MSTKIPLGNVGPMPLLQDWLCLYDIKIKAFISRSKSQGLEGDLTYTLPINALISLSYPYRLKNSINATANISL